MSGNPGSDLACHLYGLRSQRLPEKGGAQLENPASHLPSAQPTKPNSG